jgi:DnaJ like chaperone protein
VRTALSLFGLDKAATFEQVRATYRELVKSYQPDKLAHLGQELRRVAEMKTKEINTAYRVLEKFYAA